MGIRATIRINGKLMLATHWDGNPETLGRELAILRSKKMLNTTSIIRLASEHSINAAHPSIMRSAKKFNIMNKSATGGDIWNIKEYDDFAEYEYDISLKTKRIKCTPLGYNFDRPSAGYHNRIKKKSFYL